VNKKVADELLESHGFWGALIIGLIAVFIGKAVRSHKKGDW
jgi:hypothetical protein